MTSPQKASNADRHDEEFDPANFYYELTAGKDVTKLGMRYVKTEIVSIAPGGWAEKNKIEIDDEIWEINGKSFVTMTQSQRLDALTGPRPLNLKFKRPKIKDSYYEIECHDVRLGMRYVRNTITEVKDGGWALKNGVKVGDQLIQLNDRLFESLTEDQVLKMLAGPRPLKLQFKRPASEHLDKVAIKEGEAMTNHGAALEKPTETKNESDGAAKKEEPEEKVEYQAPAPAEDNVIVEEERAPAGGGLMGFLCCQAPAKNNKKK